MFEPQNRHLRMVGAGEGSGVGRLVRWLKGVLAL